MNQFLNFAQLFLYYCGKPYVQMKLSKQATILLIVLNWACDDQPNQEEITNSLQNGIITAEIIHAAGEYPQLFFNLENQKYERRENNTGLPAPFNIGRIKYFQETAGRNIYILILGAAIPRTTQMDIKTIGMIRFLNEVELPLIVGVPYNVNTIAPPISDFQTLLFENDPSKRLIEQWMTYHKFPFPFTSFFWEDEKATKDWLARHQIFNQ